MKYQINNYNNQDIINDKVINNDVFSNEKTNYVIKERRDAIDQLISWISEATDDRDTMKQDLYFLMSLKDKFILSSISTNEYLRENSKEGQAILEEIYNL